MQGFLVDYENPLRLITLGNNRTPFHGTLPNFGDWVIMRRVGDTFEFYKSTDGITRTLLTPPDNFNIGDNEIVVTGFTDDEGECVIYYPQFKGLTLIE